MIVNVVCEWPKGPCQNGEWLVASKMTIGYQTKIKVSCRQRVCPCLAHDQDMCEIQLENSNSKCQNCVVALGMVSKKMPITIIFGHRHF